jgi:hypothetical protein
VSVLLFVLLVLIAVVVDGDAVAIEGFFAFLEDIVDDAAFVVEQKDGSRMNIKTRVIHQEYTANMRMLGAIIIC